MCALPTPRFENIHDPAIKYLSLAFNPLSSYIAGARYIKRKYRTQAQCPIDRTNGNLARNSTRDVNRHIQRDQLYMKFMSQGNSMENIDF